MGPSDDADVEEDDGFAAVGGFKDTRDLGDKGVGRASSLGGDTPGAEDTSSAFTCGSASSIVGGDADIVGAGLGLKLSVEGVWFEEGEGDASFERSTGDDSGLDVAEGMDGPGNGEVGLSRDFWRECNPFPKLTTLRLRPVL